MTTAETQTDPRTSYRAAVTWVSGLAAAVRPDQLAGPTPCDEFDVRTLLGHLVTTVRKVRLTAEGGDAQATPHVITEFGDDEVAAAYAAEADAACAAWSDDALLDAPVPVPWGEVPGREALSGYLNETLVHGWDLAVATGQDAEADPDVVAVAMASAARILPDDGRSYVPFDPAVAPSAQAGPTERLANWSGRTRPAV
jgi:uncharacterized protein (TIGR03086 family)